MKYTATMNGYWKDIADTVRRMCTPAQLNCLEELVVDRKELSAWLIKYIAMPQIKGSNFESTPQNFLINYDHPINNKGDTQLSLTWNQLVDFLNIHSNLIFEDHSEAKEEAEQHSKEITDNTPKIGSYVEEDMLGDELTFDEIADMVGEIIVYDHSTESRAWYKVVKIEGIIDGTDGKRHLRFYDGSKQRGTVNEIFFDKSQRRPQKAWRLKKALTSDFPCDDCIYDDNGCCNYPDTQDDYCVCGDKQVPTTTNDTAPAFDYSELDNNTATSLRACESVIRTETAGYFTMLGAKFKEAQELLASHSSGTFEKWYTSMGFKRQTVYNLIQRFEFSSSPTIGGREESFEALPLTLSYAISKPDAPSELVEKVLDGDITTHKDYIALKKQLAEQTERAEKLEKEVTDLDVRLDEEIHNSYELEDVITNLQAQVKKLEEKPVEAVFSDNSAELAEKDSEIAELKEELERLSDKNIKNFVIKLSVEQFDALLKLVKECEDIAIRTAVLKAQILRV